MSVQSLKVFARVRPLNQRELVLGSNRRAVFYPDYRTVAVSEQSRDQCFQVDHIFAEEVDNAGVFTTCVTPLVGSFLQGANSTVFAYGITGAGKSFTMLGSEEQSGLIQLTLEHLLAAVGSLADSKLRMSYIQIYNQQVLDLLQDGQESLQIVDDPLHGVTVPDLLQTPIVCVEDALNIIGQGNARRAIAETKANEVSSRSHAIVQVLLQRLVGDRLYASKLSLVDLAGSERQSGYGEHQGIRNLQGSNINRSLLTLGNCINLLSERRKGAYIPYRDSKLTRLLKDSLGGNTRTVMIACISPSILSIDETLNTLKYACRAKKIEKVVQLNVFEPRNVEDYRKEIVRLRTQIEALKDQQSLKEQQALKHQQALKQQLNQVSGEAAGKLVRKLITNVETLTILRREDALGLQENMYQITLMEQQSELVKNIAALVYRGMAAETVSQAASTAVIVAASAQAGSESFGSAHNAISVRPPFTLNERPQDLPQINPSDTRLSEGQSHILCLHNESFVADPWSQEMSARRQLETHIHSLHKDQYVAGRKTELRFAPANLESLRSKLQQDRKDIRQLAKEYERRQEEGRQITDLQHQAACLLAKLTAEVPYGLSDDVRILEGIANGGILQPQRDEETPNSMRPPLRERKANNGRHLVALCEIKRMLRNIVADEFEGSTVSGISNSKYDCDNS